MILKNYNEELPSVRKLVKNDNPIYRKLGLFLYFIIAQLT
jgi:hypothetical protein